MTRKSIEWWDNIVALPKFINYS